MFDVGKTHAMHNDNLIVKNGIFYKADTLQKFTGVTTGKEQFTIENGILEGPYSRFYDNGRLREEGSFYKWFMIMYSQITLKPNHFDHFIRIFETRFCYFQSIVDLAASPNLVDPQLYPFHQQSHDPE